jgi:hypothetical protein
MGNKKNAEFNADSKFVQIGLKIKKFLGIWSFSDFALFSGVFTVSIREG